MADKFMYIPNDDLHNYQLVETFGHSFTESTNQNSQKVAKVGRPTNKKTLLLNFEY